MEVCGRGLGREVQDLQGQPGGEIGRLRKQGRILYGGGGMECHVWHFGHEPMNLALEWTYWSIEKLQHRLMIFDLELASFDNIHRQPKIKPSKAKYLIAVLKGTACVMHIQAAETKTITRGS